jgi:hypothetical protein
MPEIFAALARLLLIIIISYATIVSISHLQRYRTPPTMLKYVCRSTVGTIILTLILGPVESSVHQFELLAVANTKRWCCI